MTLLRQSIVPRPVLKYPIRGARLAAWVRRVDAMPRAGAQS